MQRPRGGVTRRFRTGTRLVFNGIGLVLAGLLLAGCGSDSDDPPTGASGSTGSRSSTTSRSGAGSTQISVDGAATVATTDPVAEPTEVPFSGSVDCRSASPTGTGMFATSATEICGRLVADEEKLQQLAGEKRGRICTEIYGGPQHARITGTVDGAPVEIAVTRSDGCGIAKWEQLEWLLGAPER